MQTGPRPPLGSDALDACHEPDVCIDQYLWSLYERTQKVDTVKLEERIKVKVKTKGKTRTVVKTLIKYITEDFGWKDPKAAQKVGMSLQGLRDRRHGSRLQTEAVQCASRDGRRRIFAWHNQRIPR